MLFRFSLYGFLKNQRYFEPFLVLALIEMNLSFFEIGLLIGFRELAVTVMELPSGAIADLFGRRRSMMLSFVAYIGGFVTLGLANDLPLLFGAFFLLAVGDAFRTGTHKAMIFTWLRIEGRTGERTKVYGFTRSWSKIGSAVSALIAAAFVLATDSYSLIFFFAALPYALNIVNFLGYPAELEGEPVHGAGPREVAAHLRSTLGNAVRVAPLRKLMAESMGFEGVFHSVKEYLQPMLLAAAVSLMASNAFLGDDLSTAQQAALLIGPVYFGMHLLSSAASRNAHRVTERAGGEAGASRWIWIASTTLFAVILFAGYMDLLAALIVAFVMLHVLQDLWRPVLISRFDEHGDEAQGATLLSLESQARRASTMVLAPLMGLAIDSAIRHDIGGPFWPIGAAGLVVGLAFLFAGRTGSAAAAVSEPTN